MARLFFALFQSCGLRRDLIDDGGALLVLFLRRPFVFTTGGTRPRRPSDAHLFLQPAAVSLSVVSPFRFVAGAAAAATWPAGRRLPLRAARSLGCSTIPISV